MAGKISTDRALGLACLLAITWAAWDTRAIHPVRIFVTFLHEIGHAAGALATGGSVSRIVVEANGSGLCMITGGWPIVFLPAGYLGSMAFGSLFLVLASRTRFERLTSLVLGLGFVACVAFYVRTPFDFFYGLAWGVALATAAWWLPDGGNDLLLSFLGSASCLFAVFDLRVLYKLSRFGTTDATMFSSSVFPLPPRVWAALWGVLAVFVLFKTLRFSVQKA